MEQVKQEANQLSLISEHARIGWSTIGIGAPIKRVLGVIHLEGCGTDVENIAPGKISGPEKARVMDRQILDVSVPHFGCKVFEVPALWRKRMTTHNLISSKLLYSDIPF